MKSSNEILSEFYKVLVSKQLDKQISGRIEKGFVPTDNKENIEIGVLFNNSQYVQQGQINLNIYVPNLQDGRPDFYRFQVLEKFIIEHMKFVQGDIRYSIDSASGVMPDQDRDTVHFMNYKFNFETI